MLRTSAELVRKSRPKVMRNTLMTLMALGGSVIFGANKPVAITLKDGSGRTVGTALLSDGPDGQGVRIALNLRGLPPGDHAIHFDKTPKCDGPGFASAGAHFNPDRDEAGAENPEGQHAGDIGNFTVNAKGVATVTVVDPHLTLSETSGHAGHSVFNEGGTALVIDAQKDDPKPDPAGKPNDRIACGVIVR